MTMIKRLDYSLDYRSGGGPGTVVNWLKLPVWEVGYRGFERRSGIQTKCFFPAHS